MAAAAVKSANDQKKLIIAIALGLGAVIALWWTFFGFGSDAKPQAQTARATRPTATASPAQGRNPEPVLPGPNAMTPSDLAPIPVGWTLPQVPEPRRNIFAFYVPKPSPSPTATRPPPPTPTPTPPVLLASVSPSNIYARTDDFTLEVTGDKFANGFHIVFENRELPTRFISPQQMSATVPAALITNPGPHNVIARSSDGKLFSNPASVNVAAPPTPNYTYVGFIAKPRHVGDTALLQDKTSKEVLSQQRGDIVGLRFRITSISDNELVLVDTNLKITHKLALTFEGGKGLLPQGRPTPKVASEDDEPQ